MKEGGEKGGIRIIRASDDTSAKGLPPFHFYACSQVLLCKLMYSDYFVKFSHIFLTIYITLQLSYHKSDKIYFSEVMSTGEYG